MGRVSARRTRVLHPSLEPREAGRLRPALQPGEDYETPTNCLQGLLVMCRGAIYEQGHSRKPYWYRIARHKGLVFFFKKRKKPI